MTTPINVDEARVALKTWSLRIPKAQMALLNAALDRLEELEANRQGTHIPEAREGLNRLIQHKGVSLEEASFLSTAINRAEEVPALSVERDVAQEQCAEAERAANKAELQCIENLQALGAATQNNGALRAQLETALANQKVEGFTTSDNAYSQALDREFSLFCKLKTAKGLLRKANKYLSRVADSLPYSDTLAELGEDIPAFLSNKEGGE